MTPGEKISEIEMRHARLVPKLETCEKLMELGIFVHKDFTSFVWHKSLLFGYEVRENVDMAGFKAPTAQELLEKLPTGVIIDGVECTLSIECHGEYNAWFTDEIEFAHDKNLAEALAKILIWLHKNNYLKD